MNATAPLTVLHVNTERGWRGGEQQTYSLMQEMTSRGHRALLAARPGEPLADRARKAGIAVLPVSPLGEWDVVSALKIRRWCRSLSVHVVHAHTSHAAGLAALALAHSAVPLVASRRVDFHLSRNPLSRLKYGRADRIVTTSGGIRDVLLQDGIAPEKIRVVHSGIDLKRFEGWSPVSKAEMGVPLHAPLVGQVAALADHKDQITLLAAMVELIRRLPEAHLVIIGEGPLRDDLAAAISRLGLKGRAHLLGFRPDTPRYVASFDVFCLSSKLEGFGGAMLEAMVLGVPVVCTRTGGLPEVIEDGVTGYMVPPRDASAMAEGLYRALTLPENNQRLTQAAKEKAQIFTVQQTAEKTIAVYRELRRR